jgi:hypothetical protein
MTGNMWQWGGYGEEGKGHIRGNRGNKKPCRNGQGREGKEVKKEGNILVPFLEF